MKVIDGYPPNYKDIVAALHPTKDTVFTWGDTVYAPGHDYIDNALDVHESVHKVQQGLDPKCWWDRYLVDEYFRLDQELKAYQAQYKFFCKVNKFKKERAKFLDSIAKDLAGPMYGHIIDIEQAKENIRP